MICGNTTCFAEMIGSASGAVFQGIRGAILQQALLCKENNENGSNRFPWYEDKGPLYYTVNIFLNVFIIYIYNIHSLFNVSVLQYKTKQTRMDGSKTVFNFLDILGFSLDSRGFSTCALN